MHNLCIVNQKLKSKDGQPCKLTIVSPDLTDFGDVWLNLLRGWYGIDPFVGIFVRFETGVDPQAPKRAVGHVWYIAAGV